VSGGALGFPGEALCIFIGQMVAGNAGSTSEMVGMHSEVGACSERES
jgi:hypothetical protein